MAEHRHAEQKLRDALAHEETARDESVHRLLNGLQMIASLLVLQSRTAESAEASSQLAAAACRVGTISRIHHLLQSLEGRATVAFRAYLEELCSDYRLMLSSCGGAEDIAIEGLEIELATKIAIPLALIANEMITNAAKYGNGTITVSLEKRSANDCVLSVRNDGPALPAGFDPATSTGLGMKIVRTFVRQLGGELRISRGDQNRGARFAVLFSHRAETAGALGGDGDVNPRPQTKEMKR